LGTGGVNENDFGGWCPLAQMFEKWLEPVAFVQHRDNDRDIQAGLDMYIQLPLARSR
jgi:hypothetical protein